MEFNSGFKGLIILSFISAVCHRCINVKSCSTKKVWCKFCRNRLLWHLALKLYFEKSYNNGWLIAREQGHTHINQVCEFTLLVNWRGNYIKINIIFIYKKDKGCCRDSLCLTIGEINLFPWHLWLHWCWKSPLLKE